MCLRGDPKQPFSARLHAYMLNKCTSAAVRYYVPSRRPDLRVSTGSIVHHIHAF